MRLLLAPMLSLLAGMALVAATGVRLTRLQFVGAAMALGAPLLGAVLSLGFMCGASASAAVWTSVVLCPLACGWCCRRVAFDGKQHAAALPALLGAGLLGFSVVIRFLAVPAVRGDGLSIALLRALALQQPDGPWAWLSSEDAALLKADYPLGMPALMTFGHILGGGGDAAALTPLLLALPGAALFAIATVARHSTLAAWLAAALFGALPLLRTYASSGQSDPLIAAVLCVAVLACAQGVGGLRLALASLLLLPFVKFEGALHLVLLGVLLLPLLERRARLRWCIAGMCVLSAWPLTLLLHGMMPLLRERVAEGAAASVGDITTAWLQAALSPQHALSMLPLLGLLAAALLMNNHVWRLPAKACASLCIAVPLLLLLRGTTAEAAVHGDVLHRLYLQLAPALIALVAVAAARLLTPAATTES